VDRPSPLSDRSRLAHRDQLSLEHLERRIDALDEKLSQLRALILKAYEDTPRAAAEVLRARRGVSYREAYAACPLVTVRIGAYAGGDVLFERALSSVQLQSYPNWEVIVICDGRDEDTAARIVSLDDSRIRCVQRPRNGPYPGDAHTQWQVAGTHPFNEGVALAQGAWIAPIDQDDEWTEDHLDVLVAAALRTEAEVVYGVGRAIIAHDSETYFGTWPPAPGDFGFQTAIYHADLISFLYDVNAYLADEPADWNLARRMLEAGVRFEFVEKIVTNYHVKGDKATIDWWQERRRQRGRFEPSSEAG
jgi:glycosyltransferase involved in cell wall biosynthesis